MIQTLPTSTFELGVFVVVILVVVNVLLPLAVLAVAARGYLRSRGGKRPLALAAGIVLLVGAPTLLRIAVPSFVGFEYRYTGTIIQSVELLGLLVIVYVIHE